MDSLFSLLLTKGTIMGKVVFHTVMVFITGGLWLIPLFVWYVLKKV